MRKIEQQMITAIRYKQTFSKANTAVRPTTTPHGDGMRITLHGNHIATVYDDNRVDVCDAGWQSNTTKSRLNAIIGEFTTYFFGIHQKNYEWFLTDADGKRDMLSKVWYTINQGDTHSYTKALPIV